jgi:hypothetical protein
MTMNESHRPAARPAASPTDIALISELLTDFAWFADRGDGEGLSGLFQPDGVLHVGGQTHVGRQQIGDDCVRRAAVPGRKVRHVWSNLRVERAEPGRIVTAAVQLTFEQLDPQAGSTQLRINDVFDTFTRDLPGPWRFAARRIERAMGLTL